MTYNIEHSISQSQLSLVDALEVGGYIEEMDILDLQTFIANSDYPNVIAVYDRLMMGFRNHLRAFVGALPDEGIMYVPVLMDDAAYQAIITTPFEQGPNHFYWSSVVKGFIEEGGSNNLECCNGFEYLTATL